MTQIDLVCTSCGRQIATSRADVGDQQNIVCPYCGTALDVFERITECNRAGHVAFSTPQIELTGFEVLEQIGRGGMGVVFLARQLSLNRKVAIKVLPRELTAGAAEADLEDRLGYWLGLYPDLGRAP